MSRHLERVGAESFRGSRLLKEGTWAVAFLADWCPFCQAFRPNFESMRLSVGGRLIADVTEEESPLWDTFAIEVIPTVVVFRGGIPIARFDGVPGVGLEAKDLDRIASALEGADRSRSISDDASAGTGERR